MTVDEVMTELQANGNESIKKILLKHGVKEPFFGVKVEYLKKIQKKTKTDYELAKGLFETGNADAMYLAGLITDDAKMTKAELQHWVELALSNNIGEYTVPWVAAGSRFGFELGLKWIDSGEEGVAASGWATLANLVALKPDAELDMNALKSLLTRIEQTIHTSSNRVRYQMNNFIISVGAYVSPLIADAFETAKKNGTVMVDMNGTACKVPAAKDYIKKARDKNPEGKKKKTVKC
ncbi:DNA alkylation repair protein [Mucilaginibacter psychrotolerans]|uniref:DNA alkylation repair protein n=1 Tax=Mucilaginibacter psychrotolerans TaxID=1524096 RepID=A0A4Y8S5H2_9SPHI|nr:DNA alkylation repair protein [Mucilaginibacter psychrotolerans]TFF33800.1 DNA alkylation repair protein [Mucilaginibacter psychrotolerans]